MTALAPVGVIRAVYDSRPISGAGVNFAAVAAGEFFLFSMVGSSGSPVVFMETESTTTESTMRKLMATDPGAVTLTVTGWDGVSEFVNLGTSPSGSGTSYTATVSKED